MISAQINGKRILCARVAIPRCGIWHMNIESDGSIPLTGEANIAFGGEWRGIAIKSSDIFPGRMKTVIVGAQLDDDVAPKYFRKTQGRALLDYVLGSRKSNGISSSILSRYVGDWCFVRQPRADAIRSLAEALSATWRVLPDGSIWCGVDEYPPADLGSAVRVASDSDSATYGIDTIPDIRPGMSIDGLQIERVEYFLEADSARMRLFFGARPESPLETAVKHYTARLDFYAMYPARVVAQNPDGSLELKPDDARLPGFSAVPIRYGVPGIRVEVVPGARIGIEFEGGNPSAPVATLWASGTVSRLFIDATQIVLNGGTLPIARAGDMAGPYPIVGGNPTILG